MSALEALRLAIAQLRAQKLKTFFGLIGVVIGVMFLIAVVSIVEGMSRYMERDIIGMTVGVNTFELRRFPMRNFGDVSEEQWREWQRRPRVQDDDVAAVAEALPPGTRWAAQSIAWDKQVSSPHARPRQVQLYAVSGDYFQIQNVRIATGRTMAPQELALGTPVVVVGDEVARHFFPNLDPIGRTLAIEGLPFRVIGVAEAQGSMMGMSLDKFVITPLNSPARRVVGHPPGAVGAMIVQGTSLAQMSEAMEQTRQLMRGRHKLRPAQGDDFALETSEAAAEFLNKIKGIMTMAGTTLPLIGLIVGAMVIMNIMLMSVAERTREIGIRKALGARRRDILRQFLIESATVSTLGAAIGVALGIVIAGVIAWKTPLPAAVAPWSVIAAVLMGAGVGILAGIYPASRAARLDPVAAMRQET